MTQQNINFGAFPDDLNSDAIRTAFEKVQNNFTELYDNTTNTGVDRIAAGRGISLQGGSNGTGNVLVSANLYQVAVTSNTLVVSGSPLVSGTGVINIDLNQEQFFAGNVYISNGLYFGNSNFSQLILSNVGGTLEFGSPISGENLINVPLSAANTSTGNTANAAAIPFIAANYDLINDGAFTYANTTGTLSVPNVDIGETLTVGDALGATVNVGNGAVILSNTGNITANAGTLQVANIVCTDTITSNSTISANDVFASNLTMTGTTRLGEVGQVKINGGINGYVLQTDGTGNLNWTPMSGANANGTVTEVVGNGSALGFSLGGAVTTSGNLTLSGPNATTLRTTLGIGNVANANFIGDGQRVLAGNGAWIDAPSGNIGNINLDGNVANVLTGAGTFAELPTRASLNIGNVANLNLNGNGEQVLVGNGDFVTIPAVPTGNIGNINLNGNGQQVLAGNGAWVPQAGGNGGNYSNSDVAAFLPTYNGNVGGNIGFSNITVAVLNTHITGGISGQVLSTDGTGNLSWVDQQGGGNGGNYSNSDVAAFLPLYSGNIGGNIVYSNLTGSNTHLHITGGSTGQALTTDGAGNLSWTTMAAPYSNSNVANYLPTYNGNIGGNVVTSNLTTAVANLHVTGGSNGQLLQTNGSGNLSWVTGYGNTNVANYLPNYAGNLAGQNLSIAGLTNLGEVGNLTLTGGSTGQVLTTDGTGNLSWQSGAVEYGNANVANYLPTYNGNIGGLRTPVANMHITGGTNGQLLQTDGNGNLSWVTGASGYSNANVANYLPTYTGDLAGGNLSVTSVSQLGAVGNVKITGGTNGQLLQTDGTGNLSWVTGASGYSNANVANYLPTYTGNLSPSNLTVGSGANLGAVGNVVITGGSSGQVLSTNGSGGLSWINAASNGSNYSNSDVAAFLPTYSGNLGGNIVTSNLTTSVGNIHITGGTTGQVLSTNGNGTLSWITASNGGNGGATNTIYNGTSNVLIANSGGQVSFSVNGTSAGAIAANNILLGSEAGNTLTDSSYSVAIGRLAATSSTANYIVAVGSNAGLAASGSWSIAIGESAGRSSLGIRGIAIGSNAYVSAEGTAIGTDASTGIYGTALGQGARSEDYGLSLGYSASTWQYGVAAGYNSMIEGNNSIALGRSSYVNSDSAIAIGANTAIGDYLTTTTIGAIVIGNAAGSNLTANNTIAIGSFAKSVGSNSVAIGLNAFANTSNAIVLNATGATLTGNNSGFYVNPVRADSANAANVVFYNTSTKELTYTSLANANLSFSSISNGNSNITIAASNGNIAYNVNGSPVGTLTTSRLALGYQAGANGQGGSSIAIGYNAANASQSAQAVAIGHQAANTSQGSDGIAVGSFAGANTQGSQAIALGYGSGQQSQGQYAVSVGSLAGGNTQRSYAVSIGYAAGGNYQATNSVAIGYSAGQTSQGANSIAVGYLAGAAAATASGTSTTMSGALMIVKGSISGTFVTGMLLTGTGVTTGTTLSTATLGNIATATISGTALTLQGAVTGSTYPLPVGTVVTGSGVTATAITARTVATMSSASISGTTLTVGSASGDAITVGMYITGGTVAAGTYITSGSGLSWQVSVSQTTTSTTLTGTSYTVDQTQTVGPVAMSTRYFTTNVSQTVATPITVTGYSGQGANSVAMGYQAGQTTQGNNSVAIGVNAGQTNQGNNAVAIGYYAGYNLQPANSIIINAGTGTLNGTNPGFYVNPIRNDTNANATSTFVYYNASTKELTYADAGNAYTDSIANGTSNVSITTVNGPIAFYVSNVAAGNITSSQLSLGYQAGLTSQGSTALAIGYQAGSNTQGSSAVAIGDRAGQTTQGSYTVSVGYYAGQYSQRTQAVAIGYQAGSNTQGAGAIAIGNAAAGQSQGANGISIGTNSTSSPSHSQAPTTTIASGVMSVKGGISYGQFIVGMQIFGTGVSANTTLSTATLGNIATATISGTTLTLRGAVTGSTYPLPIGTVVTGSGVISTAITARAVSTMATSSISGTTLTVGTLSGDAIQVGMYITGGTVAAGTYIVANISGSGSGSTWEVSVSQTTTSATLTGSIYTVDQTQTVGPVAMSTRYYVVTPSQTVSTPFTVDGFLSQGRDAVAIGTSSGNTAQGNLAVAIGYQAGYSNQGQYSVAIGSQAGYGNQAANSIAINASGSSLSPANSGFYVNPVRNDTGNTANAVFFNSSTNELTYALLSKIANGTSNVSIATSGGPINFYVNNLAAGSVTNTTTSLGSLAGQTLQNSYTVAIGYAAGRTSQATEAIAIGDSAGSNAQGSSAIAIGYNAGLTAQGTEAVAIGHNAGSTNQGQFSIAIGNSAGQTSHGNFSVAVGYQAGYSSQGASAVAIGWNAGQTSQGVNAIAIGYNAGSSSQGNSSIAIGTSTGATANSVVISGGSTGLTSTNAGFYVQPIRNDTNTNATTNFVYYNTSTKELTYADAGNAYTDSIANGTSNVSITTTNGPINFYVGGQTAGNVTTNITSLGYQAGQTSQSSYTVAIGYAAGKTSQATEAIAIGDSAGSNAQGTNAVAVGYNAGFNTQGNNAVAIGFGAGNANQGANSVAIGANAGASSQTAGSIAINATGSALNPTTAGLYVNPVRTDSNANAILNSVYFNTGTKELTYAPTFVSAPASNTSAGVAGQMAYNAAGNLYVCVATNTWSRISGTTSW